MIETPFSARFEQSAACLCASPQTWYAGRIAEGNPKKGTRTILFDDGDVRKGIDVAKEVERGNLRAETPKGTNIGARIRVLVTDGWWYGGRVVAFDQSSQKYTIAFDDGDKVEYDLMIEAKDENCRPESEKDAVRRPLRVVVVEAKDAVRAIDRERARRKCAGALASKPLSLPLPPSHHLPSLPLRRRLSA